MCLADRRTDGQTDGQTDEHHDNLTNASRAKNEIAKIINKPDNKSRYRVGLVWYVILIIVDLFCSWSVWRSNRSTDKI